MVIDSSALVAILEREEGWERLLDALAHAPVRRISAATLLEATSSSMQCTAIPESANRSPLLDGRFPGDPAAVKAGRRWGAALAGNGPGSFIHPSNRCADARS